MRKILLILTAMMASSPSYGTDKALDLQVSGLIVESPKWTDTADVTITGITLDFSSHQAGNAASDVNSDTVNVKFVNPANPELRVRYS